MIKTGAEIFCVQYCHCLMVQAVTNVGSSFDCLDCTSAGTNMWKTEDIKLCAVK